MRVGEGELDPIVRAAQAGDREALERLLASLRGPLLRFARGLGRGLEPEDAVQEALLDIARAIGGYRWEASFLSWAYAICAVAVNHAAGRSPAGVPIMAEIASSLASGMGRVAEVVRRVTPLLGGDAM